MKNMIYTSILEQFRGMLIPSLIGLKEILE